MIIKEHTSSHGYTADKWYMTNFNGNPQTGETSIMLGLFKEESKAVESVNNALEYREEKVVINPYLFGTTELGTIKDAVEIQIVGKKGGFFEGCERA